MGQFWRTACVQVSFIKNLSCTVGTSFVPFLPKTKNVFISHKLKALIQNYECTAQHFWTKHMQHFPEIKCAICFEAIEHTKRLSGPSREVLYIGCCFSKVHPACLFYLLTCYISGTETVSGLRDSVDKQLH